MTMQTVELDTTQVSEEELARRWRVEQLRRAGYTRSAAHAIGNRRDVDLHLAVEDDPHPRIDLSGGAI